MTPCCTVGFINQSERSETQKKLCFSILFQPLTVKGVIVGLQPASDGLIHILLFHTLYAQILKTESNGSIRSKVRKNLQKRCLYLILSNLEMSKKYMCMKCVHTCPGPMADYLFFVFKFIVKLNIYDVENGKIFKKKKKIFISKYLAAVKFVLRLLCDDGAHLKIC